MKATKVDGVYTADPVTDPDARLMPRLTYQEVLQRGLRVMDAAAISLCMENEIPIQIFNIHKPGITQTSRPRRGHGFVDRPRGGCMNEVVLKEIESRMLGAAEAFKRSLTKLRTGRASLAVVDGVMVDYYGSRDPAQSGGALSVPDPTTITIAPWEPGILAEIEKAILKSNLGLTPNNDGKVVRLNIPPLTEERRKDLVKIAQGDAENARNQIRQIRRDGNDRFKSTGEGQRDLRGSDARRPGEAVQKLTDTYVGKINDILKEKEAEIMEV